MDNMKNAISSAEKELLGKKKHLTLKDVDPKRVGGAKVSIAEAFKSVEVHESDKSIKGYSVGDMKRDYMNFCLQRAMGLEPKHLLVSGASFTGKTHCARVAEAWMRSVGIKVIFMNWPEMYDMMKSRGSNGDWTIAQHWAEQKNSVLIIDDLCPMGSDRSNEDMEQLYRVSNARVGQWTIWTTNLTETEIREQIADKVLTRITRNPHCIGPLSSKVDEYGSRTGPLVRD